MIISQKIERGENFNAPDSIGEQFDIQIKTKGKANGPHNLKNNKNINSNNDNNISYSEWIIARLNIPKDLNSLAMPFILIVCAGSILIFSLYLLKGFKAKEYKTDNPEYITDPNIFNDDQKDALYLGGRKKRLPNGINYNELFLQRSRNYNS